jgi:hypothetical protein
MNIINLLIFVTFIVSFCLLVHYKLVKNTNTSSNTRAIVKSSSNPNEYFPVIVSDTNSSQQLLTDPIDLNYNAQTGTLYAKNISAKFNGATASALNLAKNGTGNLLLQTNSTTTSLLPQGNSGQVLTSQANNAPIWTNVLAPSGSFRFPTSAFFGTGESGDATYSGTFGGGDGLFFFFNNLTINSGSNFALSGSKVFVSGTLTLGGLIFNNGEDATGSIGGRSGSCYPGDKRDIRGTTALSTYITSSPPKPPTVNSLKDINDTAYTGGAGGFQNTNPNGGSGGASSSTNNVQQYAHYPMMTTLTNYIDNKTIDGGSAGGCGQSFMVNNIPQLGGGGGGGGGVVHICANRIVFNSGGRIEAKGGNGGNTTNNGGGGGGGGGGLIFIVTRGITGIPSYNVTGGIGGTSGNALSSSARGTSGRDGKVVIITL